MTIEQRNTLIERHLPRIWLIARSFGYALPPGVILEDLVQAACEALISSLDRGRPWRWTRVRGAMRDALRREERNHRTTMPADVASSALNPEDLAIRSERRRIVQRNAATLNPRELAVLRLASGGAKQRAIARELRITDRHARRLYESGLKRIKSAIAA